VFQGILQVRGENLTTKEQLISLWAHESQRVFHDRLVDEKDKDWFLTLLQGFIHTAFEFEWTLDELRDIIFGDYTSTSGDYIQITELEGLNKKFNDYLVSYNAQNPSKIMNLVFFKDAIMHLSRIIRIVKQNRGNALLIGVGGSGRQSLTRLAASMKDCRAFSIEITKNYKDPQWKEDLKLLLKNAGKGEKTAFIFSDTQIVKESFLEDINNVLNTGEVPNMWAP
jgi:dynein heavy chain